MTERFIPGASGSIADYVEQHHLARYEWAARTLGSMTRRIVDVACGAGYGSCMLARETKSEVIGIDLSTEAVAAASRAYSEPNLSFQQGNAENLSDLPDRSVDAVVSFETIEHLQNPRAFLAEAARILRPEGLLLVSSPNRLLASTMYPLRGRPNNPFHVFEYTESGFWADLSLYFVVEQKLGQGFVTRFLAFWPIQVALKAVCHALRGWGAYHWIDKTFHDPADVSVVPLKGYAACPSFLVARCKPRQSPGADS